MRETLLLLFEFFVFVVTNGDVHYGPLLHFFLVKLVLDEPLDGNMLHVAGQSGELYRSTVGIVTKELETIEIFGKMVPESGDSVENHIFFALDFVPFGRRV